ncbi:MAG: hypothetical protein JWN66_1570 [Sphingomonas bacterium]|uniref:MFS transporter n=1 Tax=Sphingomonas bacterium TaxID=1895847 RepID=UPI0026265684|nr:MFS transporter [Sphingomonas bacterium]MDB5704454.1 hypothetical protein [Sphingomonas bacterium]
MTPRGRGRLAAFTIGLAVTMSVLDGVMLNVALPSIAGQLQASPAEAIWVVNAYQLAVAVVLLPIGKAADIYGHTRLYLGCIALFAIASLGCAMADDLWSLAAWRFVQGCGGAGIMGVTNAMLRFVYPPEKLSRGISVNSLLVALALAGGPSFASLVVTLASWRWLFIVNLPVTLLLLAMGIASLPAPGKRDGERLDAISVVLSMATFGLILLALDAGAHRDGATVPVALGIGGIAAGTLLLRRQVDMTRPLFPVDLLRTRRFGLSVGAVFAASAAQLLAYVVLPFHFQQDLGRTQIETGLLFLPWPLMLAAVAPFGGWLGNRIETGPLCAIGLALFASGLLLLALIQPDASVWDIAWRMGLCGFGYGIFQPPSSKAVILASPIERSGSASVMGATARVLGQASGAAVAALMFRLLPAEGRTVALLVAALFAAIGIVTSLARGPQPLAARSTG